MASHTQEYPFNIEPCRACGEKRVCHTASGKEKQCKSKKQTVTLAVLWQPRKIFHHTKREITKPKEYPTCSME